MEDDFDMRSATSSLVSMVAGLYLAVLGGCASVDTPATQEAPDIRFSGAIAPGLVQGERSAQVLATVEAGILRAFPRASLLPSQARQADVLLDINVYFARLSDTRSSQEQRNCRRWSEPDKDAKGTLQKLVSRNCLDWQVQQIPCLTRTYEVDVQLRSRDRADDRILLSNRKVFMASERQCGDKAPATAALQAQAENEVATWAAQVLKPSLISVAARATTTVPIASELRVAQQPPIPAPVSAAAVSGVSSVEAHALVIGNSAYAGSARLTNPGNDAAAISRKLSDLGFKVTRIDDGDREALVRGLVQFQQRASSSQVTVLYYSGHGMQIDGVNYLLPVNIDPSKPSTLKLQALPLDTIIETYVPGRTRLVFLDACRDNPAVSASTRGFSRGLAPIQAPAGTLIAYATRDGGVAEDGKGRHSPFTQALLDMIDEPEDISLILRKVRDRVMQETAGRQQPWEYGSLSGGALVLSSLKRLR